MQLAQQAARAGVEIPDAVSCEVTAVGGAEVELKGIVLLAHGSRDPQWTVPFEQIRAEVERRLPANAHALAYLEHSQPDLMTAVDQLVNRGATLIEVVPLFLVPAAMSETMFRTWSSAQWRGTRRCTSC